MTSASQEVSSPPPSTTADPEMAINSGKLVETTNALSKVEFAEHYCSLDDLNNLAHEIESLSGREVIINLLWPNDLEVAQADVLTACLGLIDASSADDYRASGMKWSLASKRKEMLLPDMRYLVIQEKKPASNDADDGNSPSVFGFISYMITYEDGYEVVYIYEIHLEPALCGQGVGKVLLAMVETIARKVKVEKAMLTVFKSNRRASKWYDRMGYAIDDFSPPPRILRNGTIKEPKYVILSKALL